MKAIKLRFGVVGTRRNIFGPLHYAPRFYEAYCPESFVSEGDDRTDSGLHGITLTKYRTYNK